MASRIPICRECLASLRPLAGPMCRLCGRPFVSALAATAQRPLCHACRRGIYAFDLARSFGAYDGPLVPAITLLKYHAVTPLGDWFAARLAELVGREREAFAADVVVPVPLHATRLRERGYNQAELIARPLARRLRLPFRSYLLYAPGRAPTSSSSRSGSAGAPCVALTRYAQATGLTSCGSYW